MIRLECECERRAVLPHQISLSAALWGRASASSRSPSAVNRLLINLQTNTAAESQTSPGNRTGECGVLPTRGGLARCLLAPGRPSAAPLRRSSRSGPTSRREGTDVSWCCEEECRREKQSGRPTRISGVCRFPSALLPGTSHLEM